MSEGIFVLPRTDASNQFRQLKTAAFGIAGASVSAKAGRLYRLSVVNSGATAYYLQLFSKATAPVATDVPIWERRLALSGDLELDFALSAPYFALGIGVAISTTPGVLTLGAANDAIAYALYSAVT